MSSSPQLGPVALCTLITNDGKALVDAYRGWLHQQISAAEPVAKDTACAIGYPQLQGAPSWLLANTRGRRWLQVVEHPQAIPRDSLRCHGWMAMETLVEDVDSLAASFTDSPFELLRPPADLDVSDKIRACQVRGPAGEILYLTQVNGEVPPFELPRCEAPVDHMFIPVLSTPSRQRSLEQYSAISGNPGLSFDTKISVVNQARGFNLDLRHAVATLQLAGSHLIEIDEIADTGAAPEGICSGMASVAFLCNSPLAGETAIQRAGPFSGHSVRSLRGCAGEHFSLIYPSDLITTGA